MRARRPRFHWWGIAYLLIAPSFWRWTGADRRGAASLFIGPLEIRWARGTP